MDPPRLRAAPGAQSARRIVTRRPGRDYPELRGNGLELRPWDSELAEQMGNWSLHGFPYHAFDLGHLRDAATRENAVQACRDDPRHYHFVAVEDGVAVGRVSVNPKDVSGSYLWSVHVPPDHEGKAVCRRMLAVLMQWLEVHEPRPSFLLTSNAFNHHAHRAYEALGFQVSESRWHFDRQISEQLWKVTPKEREPIQRYLRFQSGRWQVKTHIFRREPGAPTDVSVHTKELAG